jgi:hypothetical protein
LFEKISKHLGFVWTTASNWRLTNGEENVEVH